MRKLIIPLFILIINFTFAQTKQFIYDYISVPDSTQKAANFSAIMVLNIDKEKSEYFNYEKYVSDSTIHSEIKDGSYFLKPPAPPQKRNKIISRSRVIKKNNSNTIEYITQISETDYSVHQTIDLKWKLLPEYISVLDYNAQKATTEFGGRKWIAWFTKDIPFQDGPYKFKGLPGLIVKIEDESKSHQFELKGIKNLNDSFVYPDNSDDIQIMIPHAKFAKAFKENRKYPAIALKKRFPNIEAAEMIKNIEKDMLEDLKKDNNIIEIDLIK
ncbi:GLPGLI family protein [Kaistella flava (ex Peng et al. 2021)]|uniref:GLPGLI family protein n=1 Tax=Kaistella flava (ex Peng et al. 2021) TaxID=2038776 RepID=A0A7M2YD20_9FLAO|nr:GLPGLI family protein [Kaistella flava (ex Peng et al. 2021)]QOW11535.1 GLPGLI family protein [Kaistella flava (ex Peng et al. 2021)]